MRSSHDEVLGNVLRDIPKASKNDGGCHHVYSRVIYPSALSGSSRWNKLSVVTVHYVLMDYAKLVPGDASLSGCRLHGFYVFFAKGREALDDILSSAPYLFLLGFH